MVAGVSKDGLIRHFFHRPSKAYTTGTRKRRKVHTDEDGSETRWHKTGKTRPVLAAAATGPGGGGVVRGYKKILVLYTNYGRQRKPEKTNWVMHEYHLGNKEEEREGEFVLSKVFYQTQPRQCASSSSSIKGSEDGQSRSVLLGQPGPSGLIECYSSSNNNNNNNHPHFVSYGGESRESPGELIPNLVVQGDGHTSFIRVTSNPSKGSL